MPGTRQLIDPQGNPRDVDEGQAAAALASGWREPTSQDVAGASTRAADEQDFGGASGALKAGAFGALRGVSAGLSDAILRTAGVSTRDITGLQEAHPIVSTGSELVGAVAPSLLAPESLLGRAASATPAAAVSSIGRSIAEHATREGAGLLERAAVHSLSAAAEGAMYGGGQYISDVALGNQPLSVEGFVGSVGKGALFAAPVGGAFTLGEGALIRARSLFPRGEVSEAAANGVHKEAASTLTSAIGDGDQMADQVRQQIALNDAKAGMAQAGEGTTRRMFGAPDPATITDQAAAGADSTQLGEALHAYEASRSQLVDWLHTEADPELTAALEKLTPPEGVQRPEVVPRGEFGEPGKGGFKSQDELARLAGDGGDANAASAPQNSPDATVGSRPSNVDLPNVNPDVAPVPELVKIRDRINSDIKSYFSENGYMSGLPDDLQAKAKYAERLDDAIRSRNHEDLNFQRELLPFDDLSRLADDARADWLRASRDGTPYDRVKMLENSYDSLKRSVDSRRQLNSATPDNIVAVPRLGAGAKDGISLTSVPGAKGTYKSGDGDLWSVVMEGERTVENRDVITAGHHAMFSRLMESRLARALDSSAAEVRVGYIDGVPHLLERQAAESSASSVSKTNPLIEAWARDLAAGSASGSHTDQAMRRVLSDVSPAKAIEYIDDLTDKFHGNKSDLHSVIDSAGLSAEAAASAKRQAEDQLKWLAAHRNALSTSASIALSQSESGEGEGAADHTRGRGRLSDLASAPDVSARTTGDDLESLLRGTKAKIDEGASLRDIGESSPARADYVADKMARRTAQAEEFRARAIDAKSPAPDIAGGRSQSPDVAHGTPTSRTGTLSDLNAMLEGVAREPEIPIGVQPTKVDAAMKMRMRIAAREGGVDEALGKTIVDHGMRENVQRMTDDEAIGKLLGQRVGKNVNMGAGLNRAAKAIGDFEAASADLVDALGADAPPAAAERARGYRGATANQADGMGASSARTAEGLQDALGPGGKASDPTAVDDEISRALRKHDAQQAKMAADTAQRERLAQKVAAGQASARPTSATGDGILGKATKAGAALEVLKALGVHVPALSAIPVIGPILGLFLKAKAVMGILGRKGGSIDSTIEGVIASRSAAVQDRVAKATAQLLETGAKVAGKASDAGAGPAAILAHKLFPGGESPKSKDPVELYHARMDELARALTPGAVTQAIGDRIQTADPRLQDAVAAQYLKAMQFLNSKAPHEVVLPGMLPGDGKWQPSKAQLDEWSKYVHYVGDPASVIEDLAKGVVTIEGAETLRTVYPQLYALAQQTLIKAAPEMQKTLPYTKRIAMSIMFGVPIDSTLTASHMAFLRQGGSGTGGSGAPPGAAAPPPGAPGLSGPISIGNQTMTSLDRRAGG